MTPTDRSRGVPTATAYPNVDTTPPPDAVASGLLKEIEASRVLPVGVSAKEAFVAAMCPLCRRLSRRKAKDLYLGLPPALQAPVERCALIDRGEQPEVFDREQYLRRVAASLGVSEEQVERVARAVFAAVEGVLPPKDIRDVASELPADLEALWTNDRGALPRAVRR